MDGFLRFALGIANIPEHIVDDLDRAWPGLARLAAAARELEPILTKLMPLAEQAEPLVKQAWPILMREWPDLVKVLPTAEEVTNLIKA